MMTMITCLQWISLFGLFIVPLVVSSFTINTNYLYYYHHHNNRNNNNKRTTTTTTKRNGNILQYSNSRSFLMTTRQQQQQQQKYYASSASSLSSNQNTDENNEQQTTLPANLRRKVRAKRPPLGHVIPAITKTKGSGGTTNPKLRPQGKARDAGMNNPSMLKIFGGTARGKRLDSPTEVYLRPMMGKVREALYSTLISFGIYDYTKVRHLDIFAGSGSVGLESLSRGASHCTFCDFSTNCCEAITKNIQWCQFGSTSTTTTNNNNNNNNNNNMKKNDYKKKKSNSKNKIKFTPQPTTTRIICSDALQLLRSPVSVGIGSEETFDIITICPPYEEVVYADLLDAVVNSSLLQDDTIVVIEYPIELIEDIPHVITSSNNNNNIIDDNNKPTTTTTTTNDISDSTGNSKTLIGIRNRKYGRTVIAMYICNPTGKFELAESRPEEFLNI